MILRIEKLFLNKPCLLTLKKSIVHNLQCKVIKYWEFDENECKFKTTTPNLILGVKLGVCIVIY